MFRKIVHTVLIAAMLLAPPRLAPAASGVPASQPVQNTAEIDPLLRKPYLELLQLAPMTRFTPQQFDQARRRLKSEESARKDELKRRKKNFENQIKHAQSELKNLFEREGWSEDQIFAERHNLHCLIQSTQSQLASTNIELLSGVPVEYENLNAKLELLEKWPVAKLEIERHFDSPQARTRKWGDFEDIGFRSIEEGQEDDIRSGQEAVLQMKQMGMLPKSIEDPEITEYVNRVAQNIARNSDLKVPLQITLLNSAEINAFALPGGYLFINHGLLLEAQNEAQFAGVVAHEIAHDVARHGHRLMKKATIASVVYQAAQLGAMIFTGGAVGIGTYYALQYGFQGLGLVLSLQLLGVSRDYELEADQLGVQYVWKAGYNPEGFIEFFDIMASKDGYVEKTSFFRTHPAFSDRIITSFREITFLPRQERAVDNTMEFNRIQAKLRRLNEDLQKEDENRPTLFRREPNCPGEADRGTGIVNHGTPPRATALPEA
jgi:hypothetical protein